MGKALTVFLADLRDVMKFHQRSNFQITTKMCTSRGP